MLSVDTNLLFFAFAEDRAEHAASLAFLEDAAPREDVAVSELVLVEFYNLLRNPAVVAHPLSPKDAAGVVQTYRRHPRWMLIGFSPRSVALHDELWAWAATPASARRRIFDARLAFTLRHHGVTEFATCNVRDFQGFGFSRVWDPLA